MDLNSLIYSEQASNVQLVVTAKDLREFADNLIEFAKQEIKQREEDPYYTQDQLCKMLHRSVPTLLSYRKKGILPPPIVIGGRVLYNKADVNEAINNNKNLKLKFKL